MACGVLAKAVLAGILALLCLPPHGWAAETLAAAPGGGPAATAEGWIITLDANVGMEADYPGASTRRLQFLPGIAIRKAGTPADFSSPDDGQDFSVLDLDWLKAGPVVKVLGSRSRHDNRELRGLRALDWTLEAGAFLEYWPMPFLRTRAEVRDGLNGHKGFVGTLGADLVSKPGAFTLALGPRLNFGDGKFMRKYFSVSATEALANGRVTPFIARSGAYGIGIMGSAAYEFSPTWTGTVWGSYLKLQGDAAASPIPRLLGSRNQAAFGAVLSYSFNVKGL